MKKIRKSLVSILVITLLLNLIPFSSAMASSAKKTTPANNKKAKVEQVKPAKQKKQDKQALQMVLLQDIQGHWAEEAMTKMNLKRVITGYEDLTFQPNKPITRAEAAVMLVRILGLENSQALVSGSSLTNNIDQDIPEWAKEYILKATTQGILAKEDLKNFRPNQPAKRSEIAIMVIRALGLKNQAENQLTDELTFIDTDDLLKLEKCYILLISKKKLMIGNPDRSFQPNKPITRAEMAALMLRIESLLNNQINTGEVKGVITAISTTTTNDANSLTVKKADGSSQTVEVIPNAIIYIDQKKSSFSQLAVGSTVEVLTNSQGMATFIRAYKPAPIPIENSDVVNGTLKTIVTISDSTSNTTNITIAVGGTDITLEVADQVIIKLDQQAANLNQLMPGQLLVLTITNSRVTIIEATNQIKELQGAISAIGSNNISVTVNNTIQTYPIAAGCTIKRDGQTVVLNALILGDTVELEVTNGLATKVTASAAVADSSDDDDDDDDDDD